MVEHRVAEKEEQELWASVWLVTACQGAVQFWAPRLREVQKAIGQVVVRRDACEAGCVRGGCDACETAALRV